MTESGSRTGGGVVIGAGGIASGAGGLAIGAGSSITIVNNHGPSAPASASAAADAPIATMTAMVADVFVSYARADRALVEPMLARLRELVVTYWIDDFLVPGEPFDRRIDLQVGSCRAHIVAWSPRSVESDWVRSEADKGRHRGTLVPILLERCDIPMPFGQIHATDLSHWSGRHEDAPWRAIVHVLAQWLVRPGLLELAALVGRRDGHGVRAWATRYPDDPFVARKLR